MSEAHIAFRPASAADEAAIRALVKRERLNPNGLDWPNFIVAADAHGIVGAVQLRRHADGSRELGSLVVAPPARRRGIAARLIETLLASHSGAVHMITGAAHAHHYRRWGFQSIAAAQAPRRVRLNYRLGRWARVITFFRGLPPKRLVILERATAAMPAAAAGRNTAREAA